MLSEAQIEETKWTDKEDGASPKDNLLNNKPICFCIWIRASVWHELDVVGDGLKKEINESNALRIVIFYLAYYLLLKKEQPTPVHWFVTMSVIVTRQNAH